MLCLLTRGHSTFNGQREHFGARSTVLGPQSFLISCCCPAQTVSTQETQHSSVEYQRFTLTESKSNIMAPTTLSPKSSVVRCLFLFWARCTSTLWLLTFKVKNNSSLHWLTVRLLPLLHTFNITSALYQPGSGEPSQNKHTNTCRLHCELL